MIKKLLSCFAILLVAGATVVAGDVDLEGVQCVVAPKAASEGKSAEYKEGKVYFCCGGCAGKFAADTKKFATKANFQLVATKQYEQKACPMSGRDVSADINTVVAKTKVAFCCEGCKGSVDKAEGDEAKMKLVFAEKPFAKAFAKAKPKSAQ
ncbi:hypothetical protein K227x_63000 [Rubripirellula lacrimiformis]|uniref:YHS domain protein n=1 Tax=Rubripirellula lacrimiformis TaxID=1930273 RepID=A0A517NL71_9BACT|nr:hypothetical protein [Rubripirellula lacrimiformis]QDT07871.1 hypothetical protein K227x_63000 [Rubripirellula lacrimiformis]